LSYWSKLKDIDVAALFLACDDSRLGRCMLSVDGDLKKK
jgi:hypothetical protein